MSLRDLERSTGHAPGEELVEIEPEVEQHYEPALRVTPMSPVSEMQAYGQIDPTIPGRRGTAARVTAVVLLAPILLVVLARVLELVL
jgi:hypothetical protein